MSEYVCASLTPPTPGEVQTCVAWVEQQPILPDLTKQEADELLLWFIGLLVIVFTLKQIKRFL